MLIKSTKNFGVGRLKILVFGDAGVGKTTLAGTMPEDTLIVSLESGLLSVSDKDIPVFDATTDIDEKGREFIVPRDQRIDRLKQAYSYLQTEEARSRFKNIFFDSLSECSDNLFEKYKKLYPTKKESLNMWEDIKIEMRNLIRAFRDLPGYNVIFTALETRDKDENSRFYVGPYVQPRSLSEELPKFFDYVWRLEVQTDQDGNKKRLIRTQPTDTIRAKSRTTNLMNLDELEPANLAEIFKKIINQN